VIEDCLIVHNAATNEGGGVFLINGGLIRQCEFRGNKAYDDGGGVCIWFDGRLEDSLLTMNTSMDKGGAIQCRSGGVVSGCVISNNQAHGGGGGAYLPALDGLGTPLIEACVVTDNVSTSPGVGDPKGAGGIYFYFGGTARNCLVTRNRAGIDGGGGIHCCFGGWVENCTVAFNEATGAGGGLRLDAPGAVRNTILFGNTAGLDADWTGDATSCMTYTCSALPPAGAGNIDAPPQFINAPAGDFRLAWDSPCVNAGTTNGSPLAGVDLAGNPRVLKGAVDLGAYESDYYDLRSDRDGDGMSDGLEVRAGSNPESAGSVFQLLRPLPAAGGHVVLRWASASNRSYTLSCATGLSGVFTVLESGVAACPPLNVHTAAALSGSCGYYRIAVTPPD